MSHAQVEGQQLQAVFQFDLQIGTGVPKDGLELAFTHGDTLHSDLTRESSLRVGNPYELLMFVPAYFCPKKMVMILLAAALIVTITIAARAGASLRQLGMQGNGLRESLGVGGALWMVSVAVMVAIHLALHIPLVPFIADHPIVSVLIFLFYPIGAAAQEFIFRSFLFWRYEPVLGRHWMIAISALSFGWVHIIYGHWISVLVSTAGGVVFAWLYAQHRNFWGVTIVHALFGELIFAMGYGMYFYHGA